MKYNFDEIIERRGTNCFKWDFFGDDESVIPMPVADMDFRVAEPIIEALRLATEHGIYGYSIFSPELVNIIIEQQFKKYNWKIEKEWLVWVPGLEPAITTACKAFGDINGSILTPIPIYHPFHFGINHANAKLLKTQLIEEKGRCTFNFDEFERSFEPNTGLFLFCNPHNPGGTVFTKAELEKIAELCLKNNTIICSDEIHSEILIDPNAKHIPIASLSKEIEQNTITLLSPTKTYNTAAMACSVAVIPNKEIREKFIKEKAGMMPAISRHAYLAALAAWRDGEEWKIQMIDYLRKNHEYLLEKINQIPGLKMLPLEATYLAWIDYRESPIENMQELLLKNGVRLIDGSLFKGEGFVRLNFACPFSVLKTAVERIEMAIEGVRS
jgi:cysteine-S-conjugate beta-lyase